MGVEVEIEIEKKDGDGEHDSLNLFNLGLELKSKVGHWQHRSEVDDLKLHPAARSLAGAAGRRTITLTSSSSSSSLSPLASFRAGLVAFPFASILT